MWDDKFQSLAKRIEELQKRNNYDLSLAEDLSIAVMNLISLEEHFFLTSQKTKKDDYLELLKQTREIRKKLLAKMIDQHEGETWCISKHLLAATMRIMEVATKHQTNGDDKQAKEMFATSYQVFNLFWAVRMKLIDLKNVKKKESKEPWKVDDLMAKLVDCCKE